MNKYLPVFFVGFILAGCDGGPHAARGFRLPKGSVEAGQNLFVAYDCVACHTVEGVKNDDRERLITPPIQLGGEVPMSKTYASLLTSVINPSHRISPDLDPKKVIRNGESAMLNYNDVLTVTELIDLVTFLETKYQLADPPRSF